MAGAVCFFLRARQAGDRLASLISFFILVVFRVNETCQFGTGKLDPVCIKKVEGNMVGRNDGRAGT